MYPADPSESDQGRFRRLREQPPKAGTIRTLKELKYVKIDALSEEVPVAVMLATKDWELGTVRNERPYIMLSGRLRGLSQRVEDYSHMAIGFNHRLNKTEGKPFAQDCSIQLAQSIGQFAAKYTG